MPAPEEHALNTDGTLASTGADIPDLQDTEVNESTVNVNKEDGSAADASLEQIRGLFNFDPVSPPTLDASTYDFLSKRIGFDEFNLYFARLRSRPATFADASWSDFTKTGYGGVRGHYPLHAATGTIFYHTSDAHFIQASNPAGSNTTVYTTVPAATLFGSNFVWLRQHDTQQDAANSITNFDNTKTYYAYIRASGKIEQLTSLDVAPAGHVDTYDWFPIGYSRNAAIAELLSQSPANRVISLPNLDNVGPLEDRLTPIDLQTSNNIRDFANKDNTSVFITIKATATPSAAITSGNLQLRLLSGSSAIITGELESAIVGAGGTIALEADDRLTSISGTDNLSLSTVVAIGTPSDATLDFSDVEVDVLYIYTSSADIINAIINSSTTDAQKAQLRAAFGITDLSDYASVNARFFPPDATFGASGISNNLTTDQQAAWARLATFNSNVSQGRSGSIKIDLLSTVDITNGQANIAILDASSVDIVRVNFTGINLKANERQTFESKDFAVINFPGNARRFWYTSSGTLGTAGVDVSNIRIELSVSNRGINTSHIVAALAHARGVNSDAEELADLRTNLRIRNHYYIGSIDAIPAAISQNDAIEFVGIADITTGIPATFKGSDGEAAITTITNGDIFRRAGTNWIFVKNAASGGTTTVTVTGTWSEVSALPTSVVNGNYIYLTTASTTASWFESDGTTAKTGHRIGDIAYGKDGKWTFVGNLLGSASGDRSFTNLFTNSVPADNVGFRGADPTEPTSITLSRAPTAGKKMRVKFTENSTSRVVFDEEFNSDDYLAGGFLSATATNKGTANVLAFAVALMSPTSLGNSSAGVVRIYKGNASGTIMRFRATANTWDGIIISVDEINYPSGGTGTGEQSSLPQQTISGQYVDEEYIAGTADAITILRPTGQRVASLSDIGRLVFIAEQNFNAGATLEVDNLGAKSLVAQDNTTIDGDDVRRTDIVSIEYVPGLDHFLVNVNHDIEQKANRNFNNTLPVTDETLRRDIHRNLNVVGRQDTKLYGVDKLLTTEIPAVGNLDLEINESGIFAVSPNPSWTIHPNGGIFHIKRTSATAIDVDEIRSLEDGITIVVGSEGKRWNGSAWVDIGFSYVEQFQTGVATSVGQEKRFGGKKYLCIVADDGNSGNPDLNSNFELVLSAEYSIDGLRTSQLFSGNLDFISNNTYLGTGIIVPPTSEAEYLLLRFGRHGANQRLNLKTVLVRNQLLRSKADASAGDISTDADGIAIRRVLNNNSDVVLGMTSSGELLISTNNGPQDMVPFTVERVHTNFATTEVGNTNINSASANSFLSTGITLPTDEVAEYVLIELGRTGSGSGWENGESFLVRLSDIRDLDNSSPGGTAAPGNSLFFADVFGNADAYIGKTSANELLITKTSTGLGFNPLRVSRVHTNFDVIDSREDTVNIPGSNALVGTGIRIPHEDDFDYIVAHIDGIAERCLIKVSDLRSLRRTTAGTNLNQLTTGALYSVGNFTIHFALDQNDQILTSFGGAVGSLDNFSIGLVKRGGRMTSSRLREAIDRQERDFFGKADAYVVDILERRKAEQSAVDALQPRLLPAYNALQAGQSPVINPAGDGILYLPRAPVNWFWGGILNPLAIDGATEVPTRESTGNANTDVVWDAANQRVIMNANDTTATERVTGMGIEFERPDNLAIYSRYQCVSTTNTGQDGRPLYGFGHYYACSDPPENSHTVAGLNGGLVVFPQFDTFNAAGTLRTGSVIIRYIRDNGTVSVSDYRWLLENQIPVGVDIEMITSIVGDTVSCSLRYGNFSAQIFSEEITDMGLSGGNHHGFFALQTRTQFAIYEGFMGDVNLGHGYTGLAAA